MRWKVREKRGNERPWKRLDQFRNGVEARGIEWQGKGEERSGGVPHRNRGDQYRDEMCWRRIDELCEASEWSRGEGSRMGMEESG